MTDNHPAENPRVGALLAAARSLHDAVRPDTLPIIGPITCLAQDEHGDEEPA